MAGWQRIIIGKEGEEQPVQLLKRFLLIYCLKRKTTVHVSICGKLIHNRGYCFTIF